MIITVTLNSALDKIILVDKLVKNRNNRSTEIRYDIGGKATHVSVVLSSMGIENISTGFIAGENGKRVQKLLEDKNVRCDYVWQEGSETRVSNIIVPKDEEGSYMITEKGFGIVKKSLEKLKGKLKDIVKEDDIVVFAGGPPPKISIENYKELLQIVKDKKAKLVVDSNRVWLKEALKVQPYMIKPNEREFNEIMGTDISTVDDYVNEIKKLINSGVEIIALSLGKQGSIIGTMGKVFRVYPPEIVEVNDTGCGDVFLGGVVAMIAQGKNIEEVFKFATAISASKATKEGSSDFCLKQTIEFMDKVMLKEL